MSFLNVKSEIYSIISCLPSRAVMQTAAPPSVWEQQVTALMSTDAVFTAELDSDQNGELADMVASMNMASSRLTPPNGYRSGAPRSAIGNRARLSDRKLSLQERGNRMARQPTIETKRVSITDADVRKVK